MNTAVSVQTQVESSELQDGTTVYSASLVEMPGVVAEGRSAQEAESQLMDMVENLRRRLGGQFLGVRTQKVGDMSFKISALQNDQVEEQISSDEPVSFGAETTSSWDPQAA